MFSITSNLRGVQKRVGKYKSIVKKSEVAALNRTALKARTVGSKEIRKTYNVKAKAIKKATKIHKANKARARAVIKVMGKKAALTKFGARPGAKGARVKVKKAGGYKLISHSFLATMPSGHKGVFWRAGVKRRMSRGSYKGQLRQPIIELHGPSIPHMFSSKVIKKRVNETIRKELPKLFHTDLKWRLKRQGKFGIPVSIQG